ncbi:MAG: hypothetical protein ACW98Y_14735 [Candidatus Thorarchaeota archaeon]|jgi:hypothetical protein
MELYQSFSNSASVERPVQFMLITVEAGLNIISKTYDPHFEVDETLTSGIITALNTCSGELFSQQLEQLSFGEYTMLIRCEHPFLFCYIFMGNCDSGKATLTNIIKHLRVEMGLWTSLLQTMHTGHVDQSATFRIDYILSRIFGLSAF